MIKRLSSLVLSTALIAGVFSAVPARAQVPPTIPPSVSIDDPFQDANYLNDQGNGGTGAGGQSVPFVGDNITPQDASTVADLGKIWFTNTADKITVYVQTQAPLGANAPAYIYDVYASPGEGTVGSSTFWCLRFSALVPGVAQGQPTTWQGKPLAKVIDRCNVGSNYWSNGIDGELVIGEGPDGTGILSMTFARSVSPLLADDAVITTPYARSANAVGAEAASAFVSAPQVDNTKKGLDYKITSGGPVVGDSDEPSPPGKNDPPGKGKKKGCGKGKGKQKGACPDKVPPKTPKPPADSCPAYVPGDQGKEAPTTVVTASATEEKPVEVTVAAPPGIPEVALGHVFQNIQVDSEAADAGLYVRYEFPVYEDHDIYLNYADGSEAAHAGGFNPAPVPVALGCCDGTGSGGHSEQGAEVLDGIRTADCGGYTLDMASFASEGGDMTLKLWLGEAQNDPAAPGASALTSFYGLTGLANPSIDQRALAADGGTPAETKGCPKGKGKKKGCKKPPVASSCAPFTPGEAGVGKPTVTLTDAATESAPVEQKVSTEMSIGDLDQTGMVDDGSAEYFNIQVDSAAPEVGVYALVEFQPRRDVDLNMFHTDGSYAARSRRWNTFSECTDQTGCPSASGHAGQGTDATELIVGVRTVDCAGWTLDVENWLGEGGEYTVKLWLGEIKNDPQAPGEET